MNINLMNTGVAWRSPTVRLLICLTVFLSLLVAGQLPASASRPADVSPQRLFGQGQFERSCIAYTRDIQRHPDQPAARVGLVRALLRLDRWPEALDAARTTANLLPNSADAQGLYALAALRAGDPDTAAPAATRAMVLDGNNYWALVADGRLALWNGQETHARRDFRRATVLRPSEPDGWRGLLLSENFDEEGYRTAVAYLRLAPQGHPHDLYVNFVRKFVKNWPALRHAYGTESFIAVAPVREAALQAWRRTGASLSVTVPLQRRKGHWLIPVLINGQTFHLVFDTGASGITLNPEAAQRLHLPTLAHSLAGGVQGNAASTDLYATAMAVGGLTLSSIPIDVVRQPLTSSDGLFGAAVLGKYSVTLDMDKGLMTLERGRAADRRLTPQEVAVPFHLYHDVILMRVQVEGGQVWALLDTGSDASCLSLRYARELAARPPRAEVREVVLHGSFGIGQTAEPIKAIVFEKPLHVSLGGKSPSLALRSENIEAGLSVLDTQISPKYDFEVPLLLGAPYLDRFRRFTIDFPRRELRFVPAALPPSKEQTTANAPGPANPSASKERAKANPILDPTQVPRSSIEPGYRWVWWSNQWVELPQGTKLGPVAPAIEGQPPPFLVPAGYVALRYKPHEAGTRWMLVPQASETMPAGKVTIG